MNNKLNNKFFENLIIKPLCFSVSSVAKNIFKEPQNTNCPISQKRCGTAKFFVTKDLQKLSRLSHKSKKDVGQLSSLKI